MRKRIAGLEREVAELKGIRLLVGGLAHDFNNLITAIGGHAALIEAAADANGETQESAAAILKAAERASAIAGKLQNMARRNRNHKVPVDLNATVTEVALLLGPTTDASIEICQDLGAPAATVLADPDEMLQLLLNLALNAREAMPGGGRLTMETSLDEGQVVVTVCDTGQGMAPEVRERAFEPFYTTRERRKGTGLGLAVVAGIVEKHGGIVRVDSRPGQGSTFRVSLPLAANSVAQGAG